MELIGAGMAGVAGVMLAGFLIGCLVLGMLFFIGKVFIGLVKFAFGVVVALVLLGILLPILLPVLFAISVPALALAPIFFVFLFIPVLIGLMLIKGLFLMVCC